MESLRPKAMTKNELVNKYCRSVDSTLVQGNSAEPLLPFLLGDIIYDIYVKDIQPLDLPHREDVIRQHWRRNYNMFNQPFFRSLRADDMDQVSALMDDLFEYVSLNIMQLRSELMLLLQDVPFDRRTVIVSALLCHVLAQAAQCAFGNVFRNRKTVGSVRGRDLIVEKPRKNRHLDAINEDAFKLANIWHSDMSKNLKDPNKTKGIPAAINALCGKIYLWLQEDNEKEE